jgi:hypothetical protein
MCSEDDELDPCLARHPAVITEFLHGGVVFSPWRRWQGGVVNSATLGSISTAASKSSRSTDAGRGSGGASSLRKAGQHAKWRVANQTILR